jgi:hypothetical protein
LDNAHVGPSSLQTAPAPWASSLAERGYHVFRSVFSAGEVETLRAALSEFFRRRGEFRYGGKLGARGCHAIPAVARALLSDRLLDIVAACTAPEPPVLTGECDIHANILSRWHKDIHNEWQLTSAIYDSETWRVFKAAVYLQDQPANCATVLKVRPGSHRRQLGEVEEAERVPVRAGDVVVFDVRIDHAGQLPSWPERALGGLLRRTLPRLGLDHETWFARARAIARRLWGAERLAVYLTFGPTSACTYEYEQKGRAGHGPLPAALDAAALAMLASRRIGMLV